MVPTALKTLDRLPAHTARRETPTYTPTHPRRGQGWRQLFRTAALTLPLLGMSLTAGGVTPPRRI